MKKILKNSISVLTVMLLVSCSATPNTVSRKNQVTESSQITKDSSASNTTSSESNATSSQATKNESTKPEPYISKDDNASDSYGSTGASGKLSSAPSPTTAPSSASGTSSGAYSPDIVSDSSSRAESGISADIKEREITEPYMNKPSTSTNSSVSPAKKLSAGDIDDNFKFSDYLNYINSIIGLTSKDIIKVDVSERYIISVKDKDGKNVPDSLVQISTNGKNIFEGKTYANGKLLFTSPSIKNNDCQQQDCSYTVVVQKNNEKVSKDFKLSQENKNWDINLNNQRQIPETINLDLNFLVDATGSMGDEINSIQKTIKDISTKINQISDKKLKIRYSLVSYKDRNEAYRVKRYDFTTNLQAYQDILNDLTAGGGGDYKESLNEGLNNAVSKITWTENSEAIKLIFLVADAPPHIDYQDDIQYPESIKMARKQGIKIYPIASSGLDPSGEYIFRQLAQMTYAKFLFITYGGDEQTQGTTSHNVGTFKENNLDDLVINIIKEELLQFIS